MRIKQNAKKGREGVKEAETDKKEERRGGDMQEERTGRVRRARVSMCVPECGGGTLQHDVGVCPRVVYPVSLEVGGMAGARVAPRAPAR